MRGPSEGIESKNCFKQKLSNVQSVSSFFSAQYSPIVGISSVSLALKILLKTTMPVGCAEVSNIPTISQSLSLSKNWSRSFLAAAPRKSVTITVGDKKSYRTEKEEGMLEI
jgi:hypothetical protein